jgi:hypothetical protein
MTGYNTPMKRSITLETALFVLAFLLAIFLRLYRLGAAPLGDVEAGWALQALDITRGGQPALGPQPAYVVLTSLLFWLLGSTNFLARLVPALAGSLLVFLPLFFRRLEHHAIRGAGLVLAFGLALDPALVALSRQAGSPIPALSFGLLALALLYDIKQNERRPVHIIWAGIFAALSLLSGPAVIQGALGLALAWGAFSLLGKRFEWLRPQPADSDVEKAPLPDQPASESETPAPAPDWRRALRPGWVSFGLTLLFAGLLFMRVPQGLGALVATLPAYLQGWFIPSEIPALRLPAAVLFYQPLALIFALIATGRAWWNAAHRRGEAASYLSIFLSLWALIAVLLALFYPARQVSDMLWVLVPLWALAALELRRYLPAGENLNTRQVALGLTALWFILVTISWINFLSLARFQVNYLLYTLIIAGALLMGVIATLLVAAGWSLPAARLGVVWGVCLCLGLGLFSTTWGTSQIRPGGAQELWTTPPAAGQVRQLLDTLTGLSDWNTGLSQQLDLVVTAGSSSLRWALRNLNDVRYASSLSTTDSPSVVITYKGQQTPSLAQSYRGQDLVWQVYPGWNSALPIPFAPWLANRQAPLAQTQIILWARVDKFPGGALDALLIPPEPGDTTAPEEQVP